MIVWILNDGRIGNYRQIEAIAHHLSQNCEIVEKNLEFNSLVKLPNIIRSLFNIGITNQCKNDLATNFPDLIITAGRRAAPVALWIKKRSGNKAKIVQILKPNLPAKNFDFIITPKHDHYSLADYEYSLVPNLVKKRIKEEATEILNLDKKQPNFAVFIGGSSKNKQISEQIYQDLIKQLDTIKTKTGCKLYISTSRRTNLNFIAAIKQKFNKDFIYDFTSNHPNPYYEMLKKADQIFVTGDSISMISEAVSSGKPTIIFPEFSGEKHLRFIEPLKHSKLISLAKEYNQDDVKTINLSTTEEAAEIATIILQKFSATNSN